jgi:hypothetical protein
MPDECVELVDAEPIVPQPAQRSFFRSPNYLASLNRWRVVLPNGVLTEEQRDGVARALWMVLASDDGLARPADLARYAVDAIDVPWVVAKGDYAGTYPKRLLSYFRRNHPNLVKLVAPTVAMVGGVLGASVNHGREYWADIDLKLDWRDGDFGDARSCYWGANRAAMPKLREAGIGALRVFNSDGEGYGRAWLTAFDCDGDQTSLRRYDRLNHHHNASQWVIWNAYGSATVTLARILCAALGSNYTYTRCSVENNGAQHGLVYINGDGYVIHHMSQPTQATYELGIETGCPDCSAEEECSECNNCSDRVCQCGDCDCGHTRCECTCCGRCGSSERCDSCDRCHGCGRELGE